jgi:Pyruvate/2-oxoacid:ferredoxin oxidoreductase delta subunit
MTESAACLAPLVATRVISRPRLVAVVEEDCTGCNTCVDYCLVDCIEPSAPTPTPNSPSPVLIREDECIGCAICAKVCDTLDRHAIRLVAARDPLPAYPCR